MENTEYIDTLLKKFYNGNCSDNEFEALVDFFEQDAVPAQWEADRLLVTGLAAMKRQSVLADKIDRLEKDENHSAKWLLWLASGVAACLLALLVLRGGEKDVPIGTAPVATVVADNAVGKDSVEYKNIIHNTIQQSVVVKVEDEAAVEEELYPSQRAEELIANIDARVGKKCEVVMTQGLVRYEDEDYSLVEYLPCDNCATKHRNEIPTFALNFGDRGLEERSTEIWQISF